MKCFGFFFVKEIHFSSTRRVHLQPFLFDNFIYNWSVHFAQTHEKLFVRVVEQLQRSFEIIMFRIERCEDNIHVILKTMQLRIEQK